MLTAVTLWLLVAMRRGVRRSAGDAGQTLAEYALIVSVVAVAAIVLAFLGMRETIVEDINNAAACLSGSC